MRILPEQEVRKLTLDDEIIVKYTEKQKRDIDLVYGSFDKMLAAVYVDVCESLLKKLYNGVEPVYVSGILTEAMHTNSINAVGGYPNNPVRVEDTGVGLIVRENKNIPWPCISLDIRSIYVMRVDCSDLKIMSNQGRISCIKCGGSLIRVDTGMSFYDVCTKCNI